MDRAKLLHTAPQGLYGCGAHCDYGVLTLLVTDGTPGLQILKEGAWHDVPPMTGSFVVNLGDMLERWTSGKWKSTMHRVRLESAPRVYVQLVT